MISTRSSTGPWRRLLAAALLVPLVSTATPTLAWALRGAGLEENRAKSEVAAALGIPSGPTPAAGMEERQEFLLPKLRPGFRVGRATHQPDASTAMFYTLIREHPELFQGRVLELGTGSAALAIELARIGATVVAVDRSAEVIEDAAYNLALESTDIQRRVTLGVSDWYANLAQITREAHPAFDVVICNNAIDLSNPKPGEPRDFSSKAGEGGAMVGPAVSGLGAVLAPNGRGYFLGAHESRVLWGWRHLQRFAPSGWIVKPTTYKTSLNRAVTDLYIFRVAPPEVPDTPEIVKNPTHFELLMVPVRGYFGKTVAAGLEESAEGVHAAMAEAFPVHAAEDIVQSNPLLDNPEPTMIHEPVAVIHEPYAFLIRTRPPTPGSLNGSVVVSFGKYVGRPPRDLADQLHPDERQAAETYQFRVTNTGVKRSTPWKSFEEGAGNDLVIDFEVWDVPWNDGALVVEMRKRPPQQVAGGLEKGAHVFLGGRTPDALAMWLNRLAKAVLEEHIPFDDAVILRLSMGLSSVSPSGALTPAMELKEKDVYWLLGLFPGQSLTSDHRALLRGAGALVQAIGVAYLEQQAETRESGLTPRFPTVDGVIHILQRNQSPEAVPANVARPFLTKALELMGLAPATGLEEPGTSVVQALVHELFADTSQAPIRRSRRFPLDGSSGFHAQQRIGQDLYGISILPSSTTDTADALREHLDMPLQPGGVELERPPEVTITITKGSPIRLGRSADGRVTTARVAPPSLTADDQRIAGRLRFRVVDAESGDATSWYDLASRLGYMTVAIPVETIPWQPARLVVEVTEEPAAGLEEGGLPEAWQRYVSAVDLHRAWLDMLPSVPRTRVKSWSATLSDFGTKRDQATQALARALVAEHRTESAAYQAFLNPPTEVRQILSVWSGDSFPGLKTWIGRLRKGDRSGMGAAIEQALKASAVPGPAGTGTATPAAGAGLEESMFPGGRTPSTLAKWLGLLIQDAIVGLEPFDQAVRARLQPSQLTALGIELSESQVYDLLGVEQGAQSLTLDQQMLLLGGQALLKAIDMAVAQRARDGQPVTADAPLTDDQVLFYGGDQVRGLRSTGQATRHFLTRALVLTGLAAAGLEEGWGVPSPTAEGLAQRYELALGDQGDLARFRKVGWEADQAKGQATRYLRAIEEIADAQSSQQRERTLAAAEAFRRSVEIHEARAWHTGGDQVEVAKQRLIAALQGREASGLEETTVLPPDGTNPFAGEPVLARERRIVTDPIRIYYTEVMVGAKLANLEAQAIERNTPAGLDFNHTILAPLGDTKPQPYTVVVKRAGETLPNEQALRDQHVAILEVTAFDTFVQLIQRALAQWTGRPGGEILRLEMRDGRLAIYV